MTERSRKSKVAWSDDLSHDSEEELEKDRLAQAELANVEAPEKPSYSEEDLDKLVSFIKRMTTLSHMSQDDWNEECTNVIREFIADPKFLVLFVFYNENTLQATLSVPDVSTYDLTYFLRDKDFIFTVENFHDEIIFGTFVDSIEGSLFYFLEYVHTPSFLSSFLWPEGLTVIYVPLDAIKLSIKEACDDKEFIRRLENIMAYWIQQIKSCLEDKNITVTNDELLCPMDELDFWINRYENLRALEYQLKNPNVIHITNILINTQSSYMKQFKKLSEELSENIKQSKSIIEYFQIIKEPCDSMENENDIENIPKYISPILNSIRFIWMESPYYNSKERLTNLCKYLSNQVIIKCTVSIDLPILFAGQTRTVINQLTKCIACCKVYKEIYDTVSEAHNFIIPESWNLDNEVIFNGIDSFTHRCIDMLEVCNGMIIFGRIDEIEEKPVSRFGGANGQSMEKICENVEVLFKTALLKIQKVQNEILDVQISTWYDNISNFRTTTKHIEALIENLVSSSFKTINNVEEGVQILCATYTYSKRENLRNYFMKITADLWDMFAKEIDDTKKDMVLQRNCYPGNMPMYSGQMIMSYIRKKHLQYLNKVMTSSEWLLPCTNSAHIKVKYNELISAIDLNISAIWKDWNTSLEESLDNGLNRKLICNSLIKSCLIENNFDRNIVQFYHEVNHWRNAKMDIPHQDSQVYITMNEIKHLYESILEIVIGYNRTQISLSDDEKLLFEPLISITRTIINTGIMTINWSSEGSKDFLNKCREQIERFQKYLSYYKACNKNVLKLLEEISSKTLIVFPVFETYELDKLENDIKTMWETNIMNILKLYKNVVKYVTIVYEGFEEHIEKIIKHWVIFIKSIDLLLEYAFILNVRSALHNLQSKISGNGTIMSHSFLKMTTCLKDGDICLTPSPQEIFDLFSGVLPGIVQMFINIHRLHENVRVPNIGLEKFHLKIQNDVECKRIEEAMLYDIEIALKLVIDNVESWNVLKHIWAIPKDEFISDYIVQNPTAREFDKDIMHYVDLANDVQVRDSSIQIKFLLLDNSVLKLTIINHCIEWQHKFRDALKDTARKDIDAIYTYIKHSNESTLQLPNILGELQESIDQYDKDCADILQEEHEF